MEQYISKSALVAEIEKIIDTLIKNSGCIGAFGENQITVYESVLSLINTLEVKKMNTWHLQEKEDIYDAIKDWRPQTFVCVMKDGSIQRFIGSLDEDYEGHINVHIDGVNNDYNNVDDIVKWIELT